MKRKFFSFIAIAVALMWSSFAALAVRDSTKLQAIQSNGVRSTVFGRAVFADTERPVGHARIVLRGRDSFGPEQIGGTTNSRGEFRISGVPAGRYFIAIDSTGVVSPDSFLKIDEHNDSRFYVNEMRDYFQQVEVDGKTDKQVLVRAIRGAVITGKVTYSNGNPAVDHPVTVLRQRGNLYSMFWVNGTTMQKMMVTDDRGTFRIAGLPAGDYLVGATPMLEHGELVKDEALEANMVGSMLAMTFYPATMLATQAKSIRVAAGEERAGIDITIADVERYRLSGVVRGRDDHRPIAAARVNIIRRETHGLVSRDVFWPYSDGMPGVTTDELGRWRLSQIPDGKYIIFVQPPSGYNDVPPGTERYSAKQQEVQVSGGDVSNMLIEVSRDSTVSGRVISESGSSLGPIYVGLQADGMSGGPSGSTIAEGGKFTIRNVPTAKMYFYINLEQGVDSVYIKSIRWKGKDLLREPLDVGVETKTDGVEIVLSPLVARFGIRLRNAKGEPATNISVTLVPSDPTRWTRREAQLFGTTDRNGRCTIIGAPGEYLVFIMSAGIQPSTLQKNEIEERSRKVQRVSLRPGERKTFDLLM
jgi:hypothetical protein